MQDYQLVISTIVILLNVIRDFKFESLISSIKNETRNDCHTYFFSPTHKSCSFLTFEWNKVLENQITKLNRNMQKKKKKIYGFSKHILLYRIRIPKEKMKMKSKDWKMPMQEIGKGWADQI